MSDDPKDLRVVLAPNPSPLTGPGTNTFLLGHDRVAVIDPGPDLPGHRQAILDTVAAGGGQISHIFVTHAHLDHSGGVAALAQATGAPVLAFGPALAGRSPAMQRLSGLGRLGGGEGLHAGFIPDITLTDGAQVDGGEWSLTAHHTPGHFGNHLCFQWGDSIFCGDLVLGWATTLISPPDGDLADFMRSLSRLERLAPARLFPAHGDPIKAPAARIAELAAHRRARSAQIIAALRDGPANAARLAARLYDVPAPLLPAAARNVLAHLIALSDLGATIPQGDIHADTFFTVP
ncbi:MAG: MBL fold metallo-hydrolase [Paracoccus sp. (in: a-proteobacteria)]|uniref:MBL fold metallo-hydrolase n=1 Tax=Paracoccus sp. TaxID=267 RepID=UPI0026DF5C57|nr:MBL fold metallo-hydrolase [Paracoccus sp. (in: a-proteobacteria)]MDO5630944.1 MBL fold metallo-hydrolase [Paracoccus sp. (in: a-proteobacteria)]